MIFKSIQLKNIRSYIDERIEFPLGSTLLSGEVGSGKSTILQSIEFALFGIKRGELGGSQLLRHGQDSGSVELVFSIENSNIRIKRTLKRSSSIVQDSCTMEINGVKEDYMPTELKAKILEMFGYPKDAMTKNVSIFRYTVYTPQEEMKRIMLNPDDRPVILRKVFNVDKYGQIKANSKTLLTELRSMKRVLEEYTKDLNRWVQEKIDKEKNIVTLTHDLYEANTQLHSVNNKIEAFEKDIGHIRNEINDLYKIKMEASRKDAELRLKTARKTQIERDVLRYEEKIKSLQMELNDYRTAEKPINVTELKTALNNIESERIEITSKSAVLSNEISKMKRIFESGKCPMCGQDVHNAQEFLSSLDEKTMLEKKYRNNILIIEGNIKEVKTKLEEAESYMIAVERKKHTEKLLYDAQASLDDFEGELSSVLSELENVRNEIASLSSRLQPFESIENEYKEVEAKLEAERRSKLLAEKEKSRLQQQLKDVEISIKALNEEIEKRTMAKEKVNLLNELSNWMETHFSALMDVIEKNVMARIQHEFVSLFQNWFDVLMQEEALSVRLDENFSPIIQQNGYETEYENLSGGEKTAVALAYRLALNKVINDLVDTIKTKDILILDEPTDGFSSEQLDRIRDVINELKLKQIIIVSHETKIDTFVDNVIRLHKENHISKVVSG